MRIVDAYRRKHSLLVLKEIIEAQRALRLLRSSFADGEQPAQTAVRGAIGGPYQEVGRIRQSQPRADDQLQSRLL